MWSFSALGPIQPVLADGPTAHFATGMPRAPKNSHAPCYPARFRAGANAGPSRRITKKPRPVRCRRKVTSPRQSTGSQLQRRENGGGSKLRSAHVARFLGSVVLRGREESSGGHGSRNTLAVDFRMTFINGLYFQQATRPPAMVVSAVTATRASDTAAAIPISASDNARARSRRDLASPAPA